MSSGGLHIKGETDKLFQQLSKSHQVKQNRDLMINSSKANPLDSDICSLGFLGFKQGIQSPESNALLTIFCLN